MHDPQIGIHELSSLILVFTSYSSNQDSRAILILVFTSYSSNRDSRAILKLVFTSYSSNRDRTVNLIQNFYWGGMFGYLGNLEGVYRLRGGGGHSHLWSDVVYQVGYNCSEHYDITWALTWMSFDRTSHCNPVSSTLWTPSLAGQTPRRHKQTRPKLCSSA